MCEVIGEFLDPARQITERSLNRLKPKRQICGTLRVRSKSCRARKLPRLTRCLTRCLIGLALDVNQIPLNLLKSIVESTSLDTVRFRLSTRYADTDKSRNTNANRPARMPPVFLAWFSKSATFIAANLLIPDPVVQMFHNSREFGQIEAKALRTSSMTLLDIKTPPKAHPRRR